MQIEVPWGYISIFIALCAFYYFKQKREIKKQERKEKLQETRDALMKSLRNEKSEE